MNLSCVAICKNEEHNVLSFLQNLYQHNILNLYITDTGSSDRTVELLQQNWPQGRLFLSQITLDPFDFAAAKNSNRTKIVDDEEWVLHLDLDERIVSLPSTLCDNTVYHCVRMELLWGTVSNNMPRITPAHNWQWQYPIHERLNYKDCKYATVEQSQDFIIDHHQCSDKDFYTDLTAQWFEHDVERLFYHRMCDLMREEQWHTIVQLFQEHYEQVESHLTSQQCWQTIRNYQMARIKIGLKPDSQFLYIFHRYASQSSFYYLSYFHYYLGNTELAHDYARQAASSANHDSNTRFYNKNIKDYVHKLLNYRN